MNEVINTQSLSKHYKDVKAVSNVSLNVRKGEIYGFLGLNGAGKTTTIRMLLGMIRPTNGQAYICGEAVSADRLDLWRKIGYLVETPYSYPNLTVRENLEICRRMRYIPNTSSIDSIMSKLKLQNYSKRKAKNLSLGNAQRLGLAKALIHKPDILILDEPTNGLDPAGIHEIRELLTDLAKNHGVSIFISSHILGEVSRFATRIGIIHNGELIEEMDSKDLEKRFEKQLLLHTTDQNLAQSILKDKGIAFKKTDDGTFCIIDNDCLKQPSSLASLMVHAGCPPKLLQLKEEDLESYFLRTIEKKGGQA